MSRTYEIVCHDCKVSLGMGQGSGDKAYIYGTDEDRTAQRDFFFDHQRHRLEFGDDEQYSLLDYHVLDKETIQHGSALHSARQFVGAVVWYLMFTVLGEDAISRAIKQVEGADIPDDLRK